MANTENKEWRKTLLMVISLLIGGSGGGVVAAKVGDKEPKKDVAMVQEIAILKQRVDDLQYLRVKVDKISEDLSELIGIIKSQQQPRGRR